MIFNDVYLAYTIITDYLNFVNNIGSSTVE